MPTNDLWLRPCAEGLHAACGCNYRGGSCCLSCVLPTCILDEIDEPINLRRRRQRPRKEKLTGTQAEQRGKRISQLLADGLTPRSIRAALGIDHTQ